jgi:hypothetical protein
LLNAWDDERELGSGFISELEPVEAGGAHASSGSRPGSSSRPSRRGPEVVDGVHG